jgi:hypothetical protein
MQSRGKESPADVGTMAIVFLAGESGVVTALGHFSVQAGGRLRLAQTWR